MTSEDLKVLKLNPYKNHISPIMYRACVGNNSGVNVHSRDCSIIDGYKESVEILMQHVKDKTATVDTVVYPLLFCCRHSIELALKVLIKNFLVIYRRKYDIKTSDTMIEDIKKILKTHDILNLVDCLKKFMKVDVEIDKILNEMNPVLDSLDDYAFDTDGDTFRYTYKRNWTDTNLEDIGLIDLGIFYEKYKIISKSFDYLINNFCTYLNDLYHKTFTTKLNRNQIEEISKKLPPVALWKSDEFDRTLNTICNEYAISKTDLSKAIDLIKSHYLFCNNIGLERKFKTISEPTFEKFRVFLMNHINRKRKRTTDTPYYDITEHESYSYFDESFEEEGGHLINELPNEELCTLETFYEYSCSYYNGNYLCEDIDWLYEDINNNLLDMKVNILYDICFCIINKKLRQAFADCGQLSYVSLFDKYLADVANLYNE